MMVGLLMRWLISNRESVGFKLTDVVQNLTASKRVCHVANLIASYGWLPNLKHCQLAVSVYLR